MFGLDTLLIAWAITTGAAVAANNSGNDRRQRGPSFNNTSNFSSSSSNYSSVHASSSHFEKRTVWDWWCNGLTGEEREILLGWGYSDNGSRYSLAELKDEVKYREKKLLPKQSQNYVSWWVDENDYSSGEERRQNKRIVNPPKSKSPVWKGLKHHKGDIRTNGKSGSEKRFYRWDDKHDDIEVYDKNGKHLGSMDPRIGKIYKKAVSGRDIRELL